MCHFYLTPNDELKSNKLFGSIIEKMKTNQVKPGDLSPLLLVKDGKYAASAGIFGFPFQDKFIVNARMESVSEKPFFKQSYLYRRCVIPMESFYEVDFSKREHLLKSPTQKMIYAAGIYKGDRFVLLTCSSKEYFPTFKIPRMPKLLKKEDIKAYLEKPLSIEELNSLDDEPLFAPEEVRPLL